jgi:hypothetical protein
VSWAVARIMALVPAWRSSRQIATNQTDGSDGNTPRAVLQVTQPLPGRQLDPKERIGNNVVLQQEERIGWTVI